MRFKCAIVVASPGMCFTRLMKTVKRWSCDGCTRKVRRRFSHSVMKASRELSLGPHLMLSRFE